MKTPFLSTILGLLGLSTVCALEVTNTADAGAGSLREAIANTPAGGTVTFAAGVSGGTIILTSDQLLIDKNLGAHVETQSGPAMAHLSQGMLHLVPKEELQQILSEPQMEVWSGFARTPRPRSWTVPVD